MYKDVQLLSDTIRVVKDDWIIYQGSYNEGKRNGKWTLWYENVNKKEKGTFKDGNPVRKWTIYNEDRTVKEVKDFGGG